VTLAVAALLISAGWLRGSVYPWVFRAHLPFAKNFGPEAVTAVRGVYWTLPTEIHFSLLFQLLLRLFDIDRPLRLTL